MAAIAPTVTLILPQQTAGLDPAALEFGDATTGQFGTGTFAAGGPVDVDITADVTSIQTRRGRSSTLDQPEAGTCSLELRNDRANAGDYDPLNTDGPYWPWLAASSVQVSAGAATTLTSDGFQTLGATTTTDIASGGSAMSWTQDVGTWTNTDFGSGDHRLQLTTASVQSFITVPAAVADVSVSLLVKTNPSAGGNVGLVARHTDQNNYVFAWVQDDGGGVLRLYYGKTVAGVLTVLGTVSLAPLGLDLSNRTLTLKMSANRMYVYHQTTRLLATVADSGFPTGTRAGVTAAIASSSSFDTFIVNTVPTPIFTGRVTGFGLTEDVPRYSVARLEATDAVSKLDENIQTVIGLESLGGDSDAIMHAAVLLADPDAVWDSDGTLLSGTYFGTHLEDPIGVRELITRIERTEGGILFVAADGTWTWRAREGIYAAASSATLSDQAVDTLRYSQIERGAIFDRVRNLVLVTMDTYPDDPDARGKFGDNRSVALYGARPLEFVAHVPGGTGTVYPDEVAQLLIADYANPPTSIEAVTVETARYSSTDQNTILGLEIAEKVTVKRTAPGTTASTVAYLIVGVEHALAPRHHQTKFRLQPAPTNTWSTL